MRKALDNLNNIDSKKMCKECPGLIGYFGFNDDYDLWKVVCSKNQNAISKYKGTSSRELWTISCEYNLSVLIDLPKVYQDLEFAKFLEALDPQYHLYVYINLPSGFDRKLFSYKFYYDLARKRLYDKKKYSQKSAKNIPIEYIDEEMSKFIIYCNCCDINLIPINLITDEMYIKHAKYHNTIDHIPINLINEEMINKLASMPVEDITKAKQHFEISEKIYKDHAVANNTMKYIPPKYIDEEFAVKMCRISKFHIEFVPNVTRKVAATVAHSAGERGHKQYSICNTFKHNWISISRDPNLAKLTLYDPRLKVRIDSKITIIKTTQQGNISISFCEFDIQFLF